MNESSNNSFLWDGKNDPIGATVLSLFDGISCGQIAVNLIKCTDVSLAANINISIIPVKSIL